MKLFYGAILPPSAPKLARWRPPLPELEERRYHLRGPLARSMDRAGSRTDPLGKRGGGLSVSTEEKNKALARRFLEAQAKGDLVTLDELLAPDFADRSLLPGQEPDREGYLRSVAEILDVFSNVELTIEDQIAAGDKVATRYSGRSIHRGEFLG